MPQKRRGNERFNRKNGLVESVEVVNIGGIRTTQVPKVTIPDLPDAVCKGVDGELFFPGRSPAIAKQAKAMCARCPVRARCLEEALSWDRVHSVVERTQGIWGGTTETERQNLIERGLDAVANVGDKAA